VRAPEVAGDGSIDSRENDGETPPWVAGSGVAGASLVATGLGAIAVSRRRRRLRASRAGDRPAPIDPGAEAAEAFVRTASDSVAAARLDLALRALAARLNGAGARPQFVVRADDGTIEVHLDRPRALDAPWVAVGEGSTCWALPPRVPVQQLVAEAGGIAPPCPALVTVGRDARGEVLVDVEAVGGLHVDAPAELADPLLRSVALELAVTPLAEVVHVVTVGVELGAIDVPERLHVVHDLGSAVERAGSLAGPTPAPGESMGAFVLRVQAGHESWEPVVLVLGSSAGDLPPLDSGVAVVGPAQPNGWRLVPDGEEWLLDPVGLRLHPAWMSEAVVHSAATLLDVAGAPLVPAPPSVAGELAPTAEPASAEPVSADPAVPADPAAAVERAAAEPSADPAVPADVAAAAEPADAVEIELEDTAADHHEATAVVAAADDNARPDAVTNAGGAAIHVGAQVGRSASPVAAAGEYQLLVRVLGPVDVIDRNGEPVHFDRPKALELVVWLAQHRSRASRTAARTALWDVDVSNATFSNVVSAARRALARLVPPPHGEEWLARTYAEALPLHPRVALDVDLVEDALAASRHMDDDAAADTLTGALDLIRGAPYTGVHYLWPDAEALPSQLTLLATSIAQELGRRRLAQGDVDDVLAATAKGLAVLPGHEELVCLRMRALATSGDRSAVRREFAGYERAVLADPWSGGELADPVVATRNELLGAH
jgi:DNA-binding SARP family transcriptional activator